MSDIEAERKRQVEENQGLEEKYDKHEEAERENLIRNLGVRDRLMRRLKANRIPTILKDDLGEFTIYSRMITSGERARATKYNKMWGQAQETPEKYGEAVDGFRELAKDISIGLDADFWDSEAVSDDVIIAFILNALQGTAKAIGDSVTSFRPK